MGRGTVYVRIFFLCTGTGKPQATQWGQKTFEVAFEFLYKGAFNNYVDKMRGGGGQKMSVFVHAPHHLGINYYVNFLGCLGSNGFQPISVWHPGQLKKSKSW